MLVDLERADSFYLRSFEAEVVSKPHLRLKPPLSTLNRVKHYQTAGILVGKAFEFMGYIGVKVN
jgi:hypothetical protein